MADIDTGYGDAINVMHAIGEDERGTSAVVIEDKTFPKVTSLAADGASNCYARNSRARSRLLSPKGEIQTFL